MGTEDDTGDDRGAAGEFPQVVLPPPARAQLVELAADVVGRLPADRLPASLRAIARFTPAKRARLGGVALAAALDAEDAFRQEVADVVAGSSPQLTAAVTDGTSTAASDPVDVAVVAYLVRPSGWEALLAEAARRWSDEHGASETAREQLDRARAELAEVRAELAAARADARGEPARVREAVEQAVAASADELTDLRRRVRSLTGALRAAERDVERAVHELESARADKAAAAAEHEQELRRQRSRLAEVERSAEAARRDVRTGRDLDDARLWLLTDTLVEAAQGIRRELSLAPTALRPADVVATGSAVDATADRGEVRDAAELDQVLALPNLHLIVDGYNVTKTGYPELALADQRTRLIGAVAALVARAGVEATVVFDGAARPPVQPPAPRGVRVLFSAAGTIADDLIRDLVAAEPTGRPLLVVTSDRAIVLDVLRAGARTSASAVLLARLR